MLEITTLGNFSVKRDGEILTAQSTRTQKLWKLLGVLVTNRKKPSSISYITGAVWADGECENSAKALHNLIFRLRKLFLPQNGGKEKNDYIVFSQGCYILNSDDDLWVDAYEMEDTYAAVAKNDVDDGEKLNLLNKIVSLYNGRFLLDIYEDGWAKTAADRYERIYTDASVMLADMHFSMRQYKESIDVCNRAVEIGIFDEKIYFCLIRAMQYNGQRINAVAVCERLFERLRRDIGISPSSEIIELYAELKMN